MILLTILGLLALLYIAPPVKLAELPLKVMLVSVGAAPGDDMISIVMIERNVPMNIECCYVALPIPLGAQSLGPSKAAIQRHAVVQLKSIGRTWQEGTKGSVGAGRHPDFIAATSGRIQRGLKALVSIGPRRAIVRTGGTRLT